jgi:hypothetical protein
MPCVQVDGIALPVIGGAPDRPAAREFVDLATQGLRDDLMPETDADHRHRRVVGLADEILESGNERQIVVGAMSRSGDQPAVALMYVVGEHHIDNAEYLERQALSGQKFFKQIAVVALVGQHFVRAVSGLQDSDFHVAPMGLFEQRLVAPQDCGKMVGVRLYRDTVQAAVLRSVP